MPEYDSSVGVHAREIDPIDKANLWRGGGIAFGTMQSQLIKPSLVMRLSSIEESKRGEGGNKFVRCGDGSISQSIDDICGGSAAAPGAAAA